MVKGASFLSNSIVLRRKLTNSSIRLIVITSDLFIYIPISFEK
nr:MAG TPA: hypothetical protein [Caudoviricetes sp.]